MTYASLEAQILGIIARSPLPDDPDEGGFNAFALALYRYQWEWNVPYRQFCEFQHAPGPDELTDWRGIPAVPTTAFRHAALRSFAEAETAATFRTSGTTGEGYGSHHFRSLRVYEASILRAWEALSIPSLPQVVLTQRPADAPHSSLCHMMGTLGAAAGSWEGEPQQTWCIDRDGRIDLALFRRAVTNGAVLLLGTALAFLHLFEQLGDDSVPLAAGSLAMETGGYKGSARSLTKQELYGLFRRKLGLGSDAIFNEYSMTELSSQWYTRGLGQPHHGPAWTRAQVLDPLTHREVADGESGVLRLFDLANIGSVLAIQTQDLAIRRGSGFELIGRNPAALPRGCSRTADEMLSTSMQDSASGAGSS